MTFFSRKKKSSPSNSVPASANDLGSQQLPSQRLSLPPEVLHQLQSLSLQQQPHPQSVNPWSEHRLNLLPPTLLSESVSPFRVGPSPSPFPRCGHALPAIASAAGELFLFGGLVHKSARNDLYVFSTRDYSATLLQTKGDIPSPRFGHASAHISTLLVIWGGATSTGEQGMPSGPYDDSLYLLNLGTLNLLMSRPTLADQSLLLSSIANVDPRRSQWSRAHRSLWPCHDGGRFKAFHLRWSGRREAFR